MQLDLFARVFGGPGEGINLVAMDKGVNLTSMRNLERDWAAALGEDPPAVIEATARPIYSGDSERPRAIVVEWTKNGQAQDPEYINNPRRS
ncbi:hypothetical protein AWH69_00670 [Janibacter melonis]|uniref:Type VII secretion system protein EssD-like domain-containing protein n=1 Tax=Janibacter melonis TaxID=262209 RepID=A0A176QEZ8_9MICO|nr:DNA/RNA non-specific endonuclease [Janibacter melonis]OAB88365.1 hypothetical protein AWH69_00670 [Janibacter melonis]